MSNINKIHSSIILLFFVVLPVQAVVFPIGWGPVNKSKIDIDKHSVFPSLTGMNLEGRRINIPEDLSGNLNIVVIAFKRKQQQDVNTWLEELADYVGKIDGLELYELPTMKKFSKMMRLNINNGMRYGINSKNYREKTITLYIDKESFKSRLQITSEQELQVLLLDKQAKILWRANGLANQNKIEQLKKIVESRVSR